jgi:predicted membrane protein
MERIDKDEQETNWHHHNSSSSRRLIIGGVLLLAGLALIATNLGIIPWSVRHIIFTWQMLLIVIGLISIASSENRITGVILMGVGVFFLLPRFDWLPLHYRDMFWPGMLILIGLLIIFRQRDHHFHRHDRHHRHHEGFSATKGESSSDYIDDMAVFGGSEMRFVSNNFRGGKITAIFGGSTIDLTSAQLAPGTHVLDVVAIFGGAKLIIPATWKIRLEIVTILGGFSDKRRSFGGTVQDESGRELIIKGVAILGGGEIKDI